MPHQVGVGRHGQLGAELFRIAEAEGAVGEAQQIAAEHLQCFHKHVDHADDGAVDVAVDHSNLILCVVIGEQQEKQQGVYRRVAQQLRQIVGHGGDGHVRQLGGDEHHGGDQRKRFQLRILANQQGRQARHGNVGDLHAGAHHGEADDVCRDFRRLQEKRHDRGGAEDHHVRHGVGAKRVDQQQEKDDALRHDQPMLREPVCFFICYRRGCHKLVHTVLPS